MQNKIRYEQLEARNAGCNDSMNIFRAICKLTRGKVDIKIRRFSEWLFNN